MSYTRLTKGERQSIQQLLSEGKSLREIAAKLHRSPSTISREVKRNQSNSEADDAEHSSPVYNWCQAQDFCTSRQKRKYFRIRENTDEWNYIAEHLAKHWSPERIVNGWKRDYPHAKNFCAATVYHCIARGIFKNISR